jgi:hypothetical protein
MLMALVASVAVGTTAGTETGMLVGVLMGLGISEYAQRFSCVGVGLLNMEALAGEAVMPKAASPRPPKTNDKTRNGKISERAFEKRDFME